MQTLDQSRIEAFAGLIAVEAGAAVNAALVAIGDRLGLYRAMADSQPVTAAELAAPHPTPRALRPRVAQRPGGRQLRDLRRRRRPYMLPPSTRSSSPTRRARVAMAGIYQRRDRGDRAPREGRGAVPQRRGARLARASPRSLPRHGARVRAPLYRMNLLSEWLPAIDGARREARERRHVARRRLRARRVDHHARPGVPELDVRRHRRPRRVDRDARRAGRGGRGRRPRALRGRATRSRDAGTYDVVAFFDALHDLGDPVAAAAGRPARRSPRTASARRRAARGRPDRGQPQPRSAATSTRSRRSSAPRLAVAARPRRPRDAGGRGPPARRARGRRLRHRPPRRRERPSTWSSRRAVSRSSRRTPAAGPP